MRMSSLFAWQLFNSGQSSSSMPGLTVPISNLIAITSLIQTMPPYNPPAPTGHAINWPNWPCTERAVQREDGISYANPCSSSINMPPGTPASQMNLYRSKPCRDQHGYIHNICRYCELNIHHQQFWKVAKTHLTRRPPMPSPPPPANAQPRYNLRPRNVRANAVQSVVPLRQTLPRYFSTTMCRSCEEREIILRLQRDSVPGPLPPNHVARMPGYPANTCTCLHILEGSVLCHRHRKGGWLRNKDRLNRQRKANATWLGGIEYRQATGTTHTASAATRQRRSANRIWRACRCGEDPIANPAHAEVLQCLACEGINILSNNHIPVPLPGGFLTPLRRRNSSNARAWLAFNRPVLP